MIDSREVLVYRLHNFIDISVNRINQAKYINQ
jgi:hypothetical protein